MGIADRLRGGLGSGGDQADDEQGSDSTVWNWLTGALDEFRQPRVPLSEDWEASVAALVRRVPRLPAVVAKPLGLLDRLGAVHIGTHTVGFDGDEVDWDKVVEIRTHDTVVLLADQMLEDEIDRVRKLLPPVPGRKWVVTKVGELLVMLALTVMSIRTGRAVPSSADVGGAAQAALDGATEADGEPAAEAVPVPGDRPEPSELVVRQVPAEIRYRTTFRGTRTVTASMSSMLLLQAMPAAANVLLETARTKGITIVDVPAEDSDYERAATRAEALASKLRAFRRTPEDDEASD